MTPSMRPLHGSFAVGSAVFPAWLAVVGGSSRLWRPVVLTAAAEQKSSGRDMADIFREIDEDLRRDKASKAWQRFQTPVIILAVLIVAAAAGWRYYDYQRTKQAEEAGARYESAMQLIRSGKGAEAETALADIVKSGQPGYALLAKFRAAGESAVRDPDGAVQIYDRIAADAAIDSSFREMAKLRAALLRLDQADAGELQRRLEPLAQAGQPFRNSARELLGLAALKRGDLETAGKWLDMIVVDAQAPADIRQRAEALLGLVSAGKR